MIRELSGLGENGIIDDAPPFSYGHEVPAAQHIVPLRFANPTGCGSDGMSWAPPYCVVQRCKARVEWRG